MKAIAFDIDGILIDDAARKEAYRTDLLLANDLEPVKRRYEKGWYYHYDTPLPYAKALVKYFVDNDYEIFFITGRRKSSLNTAIKVMNDLRFPITHDNAYFKPTKYVDTAEHKRSAFRDIANKGYDILIYFDDQEENLRVAEDEGILHIYDDISKYAIELVEELLLDTSDSYIRFTGGMSNENPSR